jgi:type III secretion protein J
MPIIFAMPTFMRAALAAVTVVLLCGCQEVLYSKLTEVQANEMLASLSDVRIKGFKERADENHWSLSVDGEQVGAALQHLRKEGLPRQLSPTIGEVFKKEGIVSTPTEERARYTWALQESIANTIRGMDGVADAKVHLALPHNDPLSDRPVPPSASVFVKHRPSMDIDAMTPQLKSLVMASVEGLEYKHISLLAHPVDAKQQGIAERARPTHAMYSTGLRGATVTAPADGLGASLGVATWTLLYAGTGLSGVFLWRLNRRSRPRITRKSTAAETREPSPPVSAEPTPLAEGMYGKTSGAGLSLPLKDATSVFVAKPVASLGQPHVRQPH